MNALAIYDGIVWACMDKAREIRNIIRGYSDEWKIEHWDEWKQIRARYYQAKLEFRTKYKWYIKLSISQGRCNYADVDDDMLDIEMKRLILRDYVEENRDPLCKGKYKGFAAQHLSAD